MKKIAFCFLIYDVINFEEYWHDFFKDVDENKYSIFIHYKKNKRLKFFEKHKLKNCINTKYGGISLVHAQNIMLREALEDQSNYKFVFVSQACIPLKRFDYVYDFLTKDNLGHFNLFELPKNDSNYNILKHEDNIDLNKVRKAAQWSVLNRKIAETVKDNSLADRFKNIFAPDEVAYITTIYEKGLENQINTTYRSASKATTFSNRNCWIDHKYKVTWDQVKQNNGLVNYKFISKEELRLIIESPSLFGRKFIPVNKKDVSKISFLQELIDITIRPEKIDKLKKELSDLTGNFHHEEKLYRVEDVYEELIDEIWNERE